MAETQEAKKTERNQRKVVVGIVMSDKTDKTRVVGINRRVTHPRYGKSLRRRTKIYVHDANNQSHIGDEVEVMSTRPLSKLKRWRLVRVVKQAVRIETPAAKKEASS